MKLSTDAIRKMIDGWLKEEVRADMAGRFDPPADLTGLSWRRECKHRLNSETSDYGPDDFTAERIDVAGASLGPVGPTCWMRIFTPKMDEDPSGISEAFRIEVVTDPADQDVVFWDLIVD